MRKRIIIKILSRKARIKRSCKYIFSAIASFDTRNKTLQYRRINGRKPPTVSLGCSIRKINDTILLIYIAHMQARELRRTKALPLQLTRDRIQYIILDMPTKGIIQ